MQFKNILFTAAAVFTGFAAAQESELTPDTVKTSIMTVTNISADTNEILTDLQPLSLVSIVPRAITNLGEIVTAVTSDVEMIGMADLDDPFPEDGQQEVCEVFRDFVRVHQALLETIIGKNSILAGTPFTAPIATVLRLIETGVDDLAFGIIDLVPTCSSDLEADKADLDMSFDEVFESLG